MGKAAKVVARRGSEPEQLLPTFLLISQYGLAVRLIHVLRPQTATRSVAT